MIHDNKHATARLVPTSSTPDDFSKRKAEYTYVAVYHAVAVMPSQLTGIPLIADGPESVISPSIQGQQHLARVLCSSALGPA